MQKSTSQNLKVISKIFQKTFAALETQGNVYTFDFNIAAATRMDVKDGGVTCVTDTVEDGLEDRWPTYHKLIR